MRLFIFLLFVLGLYVYMMTDRIEGMTQPKWCPDLLVQDGERILLHHTKYAEVPGVNPIIFQNLEEYTKFVDWQSGQGVKCPVLALQKTYNAQNKEVYQIKDMAPLMDASRDNPPYNSNFLPGLDTHNQTIGSFTELDARPFSPPLSDLNRHPQPLKSYLPAGRQN